eukprot:m.166383 g.166383  ORF g.166383 m.166383 type:complete len:239 (+) comp12683_c0_seq1:65-781(+)
MPVTLGPLGELNAAKIGALVGLISLIFFEISAMASPTMLVTDNSAFDIKTRSGAFRYECDGNACTGNLRSTDVDCTDQNKPWVGFGKRTLNGASTSCSEELVHKCQAQQGFLIIGFFTHLLSIPTPFVRAVASIGPNIIGIALTACAAFSYMIVWCIWAYLKNEERQFDSDGCGLDNQTNVDLDYGGAFALTVIAWMVCIGQAIAFAIGASAVPTPSKGGDSGDTAPGTENKDQRTVI